MDNIDNAHGNHINVRGALEALEKFVRETQPLLEKFQPAGRSEKAALDEAIEKTKQTGEDTKAALKIVPKTEQQSPTR
jgi:hypothetical protein